MTETLPPPPPGFRLIQQPQVPPPPPGFQVVGAQPDTPAPAPEPTWWEGIMDDYVDPALGYVAAAGDGMRQGISNIVGLAVDMVNQAPRLVGMEPFSDRPFGGSRTIDAGLRGATPISDPLIEDYAPRNFGERIVNRVGEEIGANVPIIGAGLVSALRNGVQATRQMTGPIGRYVEGLAVDPARMIGKELTYATGAGAGAGVAREAVSDGDPNTTTPREAIADLVGALGGGGAVAVGEALTRSAGDLARLVMGGDTSRLTRDMVAGVLAREAGAPVGASGAADTSGLAATLARGASRIEETIPGFRPSTGDALGNTGVQNLEYSRQAGPSAGAYAQRRSQNDLAVAGAMEDVRPTATPGAFRETLSRNRDMTLEAAETQAYVARTKFDDAVANLQAVQSGEARGQTLRAALDEARAAAREVERTAWVDVVGEGDAADLAGAVDQVTSRLTLAERDAVADLGQTLAIPSRLMPDDEVAGAVTGAPIDVEQITGMRSALTDAQRAATAAGETNKARVIGQYVDAIDGYLAGIPGVSDALDSARAVSRDLNDRFTRRGTPVADVLATRPSGGPVVPDSQVAPRFIQPNERQASVIEDVLRETGPTNAAADARAALRDQILADVGQQKLLDNPDKLDAYLAQYGQVFEKFPDLKRELGTAAGLRRNLAGAEAAWKDTATTLGGADGKPGTSQVAKYLQYGDERAVDAMAGVVNAKDPAAAVDELLAFAGNDPQAIEGAKSAFWQLMQTKARSTGTETRMQGGAQRWRPQSLKAFLDDPANSVVFERLYANDPEQLGRIRAIADELAAVDMRVTQRAPATSGSPQQQARDSVVPSTETLGAYSFAYQRGQVGLPFIGLRLVSTMARKATLKGRTAEFEKLLDEALLNPEVAELLLRENNPANVAALSQYAKGVLGVRSAWVDDVLGSDAAPEEDDEVMGAIMGEGR